MVRAACKFPRSLAASCRCCHGVARHDAVCVCAPFCSLPAALHDLADDDYDAMGRGPPTVPDIISRYSYMGREKARSKLRREKEVWSPRHRLNPPVPHPPPPPGGSCCDRTSIQDNFNAFLNEPRHSKAKLDRPMTVARRHSVTQDFGPYSLAEVVRVKHIFDSFDTDMSGSVLLKEFITCAAWRQIYSSVCLWRMEEGGFD